jgi:hypothetical protein
MDLNDLIGEILDPHAEKIKMCVVDQLLEETITIVVQCMYKQINDGKIRIEGVLDSDVLMEKALEYMKIQREKK